MLKRLSNSWELVKQSAAVLRSDKELLLFPVLSGLAALLMLVTFFLPMHFFGFLTSMFAANGAATVAGYVGLFLFYLIQSGIVLFFNAALIGAVMIRLDGGKPTLRDGLQIALKNSGRIFLYAAISATVGVILKALKERGGLLTRIAASFGGMAWVLATYLALPVLIVEDVGPLQAIKRSANLLRRTWGEQVAGGLGFGILNFLAMLLVVPFAVLAVLAATSTGNMTILIASAVLIALFVGSFATILSALKSVYRAALYRYAATGEVGSGFDQSALDAAFRR